MGRVGTATIRFLIGCAITLAFSALLVQNPLPVEMTEAKLYDLRFHLRGAVPAPDQVVIAAIDEKSLARLGRWPWSRATMADLVRKLTKAQAAVVACDVIFPESDRDDPVLAGALADAGNVILPVAFDFESKAAAVKSPLLEPFALAGVEEGESYGDFPPITSGGAPIVPVRPLMDGAMALAHINMLPDHFDGTLRWEALLVAHDGLLYPSLGLRSAAFYKGIGPERLKVRATRSITLGAIEVPTDRWGRMPVNYYGPGRTLRHISIADIVDGKVGVKELGNRIVFIGASAVGAMDLRVTPFTAVFPGVEKQATVAANILEQRFLVKATRAQDLAFLVVAGLVMALLLSRLGLAWGATATLAWMLCIVALAQALFSRFGIWINLACPLGNTLCMFVSVTAWNYTVEERRARGIRAMFSSYVTTAIVNELIENPALARLGGEKREVSVLFSDVRGFTTFSEQHAPEEVVALLNEYLGEMTDVVLKWGGTLDKFIGDAIMVFWNAPLPCPDHAERAVRCALEMQQRLGGLHEKWDREGKPKLSCGIGINTGAVIVGNIGAEGKKMDYTVIGDEVNLASRVESLTRTFEAGILVTEKTVACLRDSIEAGTVTGIGLRGLRRVIVKGKQQPVTLYEARPAEGAVQVVECADLEPLRLTEK
ncbi:adenylate/guanylate cyclase domain-containing protein [Geomonas paludis]|uniref:Adenylate/guanylate cyclase domain-containing protein n=1 Tax=Geomonas paludis TaxID=2740185 RepID=A0A6V8MRM0_9BACT|nr:adenylate/guanylate cyclase domain-containing protein [Geomonas paludis]UPU35779.1 adenylate/guanylate cyclase domain-containing protein [Geomonas paludis]GFO62641.1 adenylate/guanylate cyclase domain-containing protein [Geomonas paludis]